MEPPRYTFLYTKNGGETPLRMLHRFAFKDQKALMMIPWLRTSDDDVVDIWNGINTPTGWRGCSIGRASDSRIKGPRFESRQEHKKNVLYFPSQKCCADSLSVCLSSVCIREWSRTHVKDRVVHVRGWRKHDKSQHTLCLLGDKCTSVQ